MLILRDDLILETFDSPVMPPAWIEWIDVENEEYEFCSETGQRYRGELVQSGGVLRPEVWRLVPFGEAQLENAFRIVGRAVDIDRERSCFHDLVTLRKHLSKP